ncbi:MAG: efflux RND transporter periplasmic adaptor subunit [Gammaproteobacteria bacterium]
MKKWLVLMLLAATVPVHAADTVELTPTQVQTLGITLAAPQRIQSAPGAALPAKVTVPPAHEFVLSAPLDGRVEAMQVAAGDRVQTGQLMARLFSPDFLVLQRDFLEADSALRLARSEYRRDQTLYKEGIIAARRWEATRTRFEAAVAKRTERYHRLRIAGVEAARIERLARDHKLMRTLDLRAPAAGVVLEQLATVGQRTDGNLPVYRVADLSVLWLQIQSPADQAASLKTGAVVQVEGMDAQATLQAIGRHVDPKTQNLYLRAEVTRGTEQLRPGQFVQVRIHRPFASGTGAFEVPATAVARSGGKDYVFVRTDAGFRVQPVQVSQREHGKVVVTGGLSGDERLATSGIAAIKAAWAGMGGE